MTFCDTAIWHQAGIVTAHAPAWLVLIRMLVEIYCAVLLVPFFEQVFVVTKPEELSIVLSSPGPGRFFLGLHSRSGSFTFRSLASTVVKATGARVSTPPCRPRSIVTHAE